MLWQQEGASVDAEGADSSSPTGGFATKIAVSSGQRLAPVLQNPGYGSDGGTQGLEWYKSRLKQDQDGDIADQFLEEVSTATTSSLPGSRTALQDRVSLSAFSHSHASHVYVDHPIAICITSASAVTYASAVMACRLNVKYQEFKSLQAMFAWLSACCKFPLDRNETLLRWLTASWTHQYEKCSAELKLPSSSIAFS